MAEDVYDATLGKFDQGIKYYKTVIRPAIEKRFSAVKAHTSDADWEKFMLLYQQIAPLTYKFFMAESQSTVLHPGENTTSALSTSPEHQILAALKNREAVTVSTAIIVEAFSNIPFTQYLSAIKSAKSALDWAAGIF